MNIKKDYSITKWFGVNLAHKLSDKIIHIFEYFNKEAYIESIDRQYKNKNYTERVELHASELKNYLPDDYAESIKIITSILGDENPKETGMFSNYYWIMPLGKYVEKYGLKFFDLSIHAIEEITKRNTGEYAIRPFIREYPEKTIKIMENWAKSGNFHLRRLASEGLRPKLPWATKLNTYIKQPEPVFKILEILKEDEIKFVQKSVANNITDYLKVNKEKIIPLIKKWNLSKNKNTRWIIKHATRKIKEGL
jgi:3-methyladenine DNA glycosylase AlkC